MEKNIQDKDYFSLNNLGTLSRIDEHLSFVEEIVEKYNEKNFTWKDVRQQIEFIRKKKNDKKLNISVIGEFATGKSTFINALLRKELLASSALQGTTVASTVIDYDEQYKIRLEYLNGRSEMLKFTCFAELQSGLKHYTTDTSVAKQLKAVNVFLPADILKNEFRIIDTPGTNVTEAWHEDVTVRTLREQSDLSIILTSAEKPVPDTMLSFMRKNLESILPQCVFVVTKLDTIRPRERDQQLAYVKMKLEEELDLQEAVVLPYVSPMVLGSEISIGNAPIEAKRRICITGGFGVGKKSLVEVLLKVKLPDCFMRGASVVDIFAVPIFQFAYAQEPVVRMKLKEPVCDSDFFKCCPSGLEKIIKKYNGVNLPEIEVGYENFCDLLQNLKPYQEMSHDLSFSFFSSVSVYLPLDCLKNEYDITVCNMFAPAGSKNVRNEATDVIMLLNATSVWSNEEKNFIHHCYANGERFIFAVNRMDRVSEKEISRIEHYCRVQADTFAAPDSPICYISTDSEKIDISSLLHELTKNRSQDHSDLEQVVVDDVLLGMSLETEQKLIQHTANQRTLAVTKKLTQLIEDTYQSVSGEMEQISNDYEHRLELLNRSQKADLSMFVRQEKLERLQCFDTETRIALSYLEKRADSGDARCTSIMGYIDNCSDTELKESLNTVLNKACKGDAEDLISMMNDCCEKIRNRFKIEMEKFYSSFRQIYQSLDIIPLDISDAKYYFPRMDAVENANITSTVDYIVNQLDFTKNFWNSFITPATGFGEAFFKTVAIPVIAPFMVQRDIKAHQNARQACKDKLKPQLTSYYNSISDKVISAVNQYIRKMRDCLSDEIDEYLKRYRSEVDRQIAMENNRRSAINQQINDLKIDMINIQNHKKQLDSVMLQLNNFGRKE